MGIANWMGFGQEIATPIDAMRGLIDDAFTSDEERLTKQAVLEKIRHSPYMAAMQLAMIQAKSSDKWTSRARPMILYTFCAVFFVDKGLLPTLFWLLQIFHSAAIPPPPSVLDAGVIMTAVAGVLGLGVVASRGAEKMKGVAL